VIAEMLLDSLFKPAQLQFTDQPDTCQNISVILGF
jgi:hypothetical protein